jgi:hypothetical protein
MRIYPIILALFLVSCEASQDKANVKKTSGLEVKKGQNGNDTITLGGGCYWCVEAVYELMDGVVDVSAGFTGGHRKIHPMKKFAWARQVTLKLHKSFLTQRKHPLKIF